ncbi:MAG: GvpL/GvpF family gas vesicle protein, partial [Vicinamibacterales bacterium]
TADVPLDVYGPDVLEPRLRDLEWVSEAAIAHEAVVEHFARATGAVVPAKLFTMFSSRKRALDEIGDRRASIERAMKHISGSEEWGVRVSRIRQTPPVQAGLPSRPASGAAFLAARKSARDASASLRASAGAAADDAFLRLGRHAKDVRRREARQEPGANPPILEAAFLVPARARARFTAEARRQVAACQAAGAELTLTGPWPAYNFIGSEVSS